jgi:hypothetical protein
LSFAKCSHARHWSSKYNSAHNRKPRTYEQLAQMSGVAVRTAYNIRDALRDTQLSNVDKIAAALRIPTEKLIAQSSNSDLTRDLQSDDEAELLSSYREADADGKRFLLYAVRLMQKSDAAVAGIVDTFRKASEKDRLIISQFIDVVRDGKK